MLKIDHETRPAYAFITVRGDLSASEATKLTETAAQRSRAHETGRVLVELLHATLTREGRDALLAWARSPLAAFAVVTLDDLFVAELNMASLAAGSRVRAFAASHEAHRWLSRGSVVRTPVDHPSGRPLRANRPLDAEARREALFGGAPPRAPRPPTLPERPEPTFASERPTPLEGIPRKR